MTRIMALVNQFILEWLAEPESCCRVKCCITIILFIILLEVLQTYFLMSGSFDTQGCE